MSQIKVFVASSNPVKIDTTKNGFQKMFPQEKFLVSGLSTLSGVSNQPMTEAETLVGALNRIQNLQKFSPTADYWVGIEGGVENFAEQLQSFAWVVIKSKKGMISKSRTASFFVPPEVSRLVNEGIELGEADDLVFGRTNSKQDTGSVGILTDNVLTRSTFYEQAVILALIPFLKPELY